MVDSDNSDTYLWTREYTSDGIRVWYRLLALWVKSVVERYLFSGKMSFPSVLEILFYFDIVPDSMYFHQRCRYANDVVTLTMSLR